MILGTSTYINPSLVGVAAWFPFAAQHGPAISAQVLVCANNFMAKVELEDPGRGGEVKLEAMDVRSLSSECANQKSR